MGPSRRALCVWLSSLVWLWPSVASAGDSLSFEDPAGDDHGPGGYTYPTDGAFRPGAFDLRAVSLRERGRDVEIRLRFAAPITDPWASARWGGVGLSLQLVHIYLDTRSGGYSATLPGVHARFARADRWDRVIVVSAEAPAALKRRLRKLRRFKRRALVAPRSIRVEGDTLVVRVRKRALGRGKIARWGVQVLVGSTDVFAERAERPWRAVQAHAGAFRFGGGDDGVCDPNVLDLLAPDAATQAAALAGTCRGDGARPRLSMMRRGQ